MAAEGIKFDELPPKNETTGIPTTYIADSWGIHIEMARPVGCAAIAIADVLVSREVYAFVNTIIFTYLVGGFLSLRNDSKTHPLAGTNQQPRLPKGTSVLRFGRCPGELLCGGGEPGPLKWAACIHPKLSRMRLAPLIQSVQHIR